MKTVLKPLFAQWGAKDVAVYLESTKTPKGYQDAFNAAFNVEAMSQVTPAWDNAASNEEKLEKDYYPEMDCLLSRRLRGLG